MEELHLACKRVAKWAQWYSTSLTGVFSIKYITGFYTTSDTFPLVQNHFDYFSRLTGVLLCFGTYSVCLGCNVLMTCHCDTVAKCARLSKNKPEFKKMMRYWWKLGEYILSLFQVAYSQMSSTIRIKCYPHTADILRHKCAQEQNWTGKQKEKMIVTLCVQANSSTSN